MIPALFPKNATTFTSGPLCLLPDCGSCLVTEERNGIYECVFTYPVSGVNYSEIVEGRIIVCTHDESGNREPFDIYARSEPIDGVVTFYAHHISYRLGRVILQPFSAGSCAAALAAIPNNTYNACPFSFWTDKSVTGAFSVNQPTAVKEALYASQGSILDVFGKGEYEWKQFRVNLYLNRGTSTGITIRYGVNLTGYDRELNYWQAYNACVPYWRNEESNTVITPGVVYADGYDASNAEPVPMDLTPEFDGVPTETQVRDRALARMNNNQTWLPTDNITVSFVPLWQTEEYKSVAALQRVKLCDKVNVVYGPGGVVINDVQVIRVTYDVLLDRYDSMELGTARASFAEMIKADITASIIKQVPTKSFMEAAIDYATELIKGGLGGHLVINTNDQGQPNELLIMDTADTATAVNVWRFNLNGLGHSHSGYNGPFSDVALTMDGKINAAMITTGTMNANVIRAGVITDAQGYNYWDLASGEFRLASTVSWDGKTIQGIETDISGASTAAANAQTTANGASTAAANAQTTANGAASAAAAAQDAVDALDASLDQAEIFDRLTNNGTIQGLFMQNGQLYVNASYIQSGVLRLGGANNVRGILQVFDGSSPTAICQIDQRGIILNSGSINLNNVFMVGSNGVMTCTGANIKQGKLEQVGTIGADTFSIEIENGFISIINNNTVYATITARAFITEGSTRIPVLGIDTTGNTPIDINAGGNYDTGFEIDPRDGSIGIACEKLKMGAGTQYSPTFTFTTADGKTVNVVNGIITRVT